MFQVGGDREADIRAEKRRLKGKGKGMAPIGENLEGVQEEELEEEVEEDVDPKVALGMERILRLDRILGKKTDQAERVSNKVYAAEKAEVAEEAERR
jgi:hypothetical protein